MSVTKSKDSGLIGCLSDLVFDGFYAVLYDINFDICGPACADAKC